MPEVPGAGQLALLFAAIAVFVLGEIFSLARRRWDRPRLRIAARVCLYAGLLLGASLLVWHGRDRRPRIPVGDNFDALIWLGLLLALFVVYTQRAHPLRGLDWFIMPIVVLLLIAAAVFGRYRPREYATPSWWMWVHLLTGFAGAAAFAVAGAAGAMYLLASRRLRSKRLTPGVNLGSLERLEHITLLSVTLGFALLTIGLVTGLVRLLGSTIRPDPYWYIQPKVLLTFVAWVVYALVLHSPINPRFRGRKVALLSVLGFVLMVGILIAVQWMPQGRQSATNNQTTNY